MIRLFLIALMIPVIFTLAYLNYPRFKSFVDREWADHKERTRPIECVYYQPTKSN